MVAANMDLGSQEYQIEAAISKVFASVSTQVCCFNLILDYYQWPNLWTLK